jgi:hypothetical protein
VFKTPKIAAITKNSTESPITLLGVAAEVVDFERNMERPPCNGESGSNAIPISISWQDWGLLEFEFRLRLSMFHPIEAPHGAATPRPIQTQATKGLSTP